MGGRKGHLAMLELDSFRRMTELHVREAVRDVRFLHNHHMYAVAQKKYTCVHLPPRCVCALLYHWCVAQVYLRQVWHGAALFASPP